MQYPNVMSWRTPAAAWVAAPFEKSRGSLDSLQIQCLLVIACQLYSLGAEIWNSADSLLNAAMSQGLHVDPSNFAGITPFQAEMRRRLWATILELRVQTALDSSMPLFIAEQDYSTKAPANVDDDDFDDLLPSTFVNSKEDISPLGSPFDCSKSTPILAPVPRRYDYASVSAIDMNHPDFDSGSVHSFTELGHEIGDIQSLHQVYQAAEDSSRRSRRQGRVDWNQIWDVDLANRAEETVIAQIPHSHISDRVGSSSAGSFYSIPNDTIELTSPEVYKANCNVPQFSVMMDGTEILDAIYNPDIELDEIVLDNHAKIAPIPLMKPLVSFDIRSCLVEPCPIVPMPRKRMLRVSSHTFSYFSSSSKDPNIHFPG